MLGCPDVLLACALGVSCQRQVLTESRDALVHGGLLRRCRSGQRWSREPPKAPQVRPWRFLSSQPPRSGFVQMLSFGAQDHFRTPNRPPFGSPELTIGSPELTIASTWLLITPTELVVERPRCLCK